MNNPRLEGPAKAQSIYPVPAAPPEVEIEKPIHKKVQSKSILAGLPSILGSLGPLPIILALGVVGKNFSPVRPVHPATLPALPPPPEPPIIEAAVQAKPPSITRSGLGIRHRGAKKVEAMLVPEPPPPPPPPPPPEPRAVRPSAPPVDMKNLLGDIAGYLPGSSSISASKAAKVMGMVDELRNVNTSSTVGIMPSSNPMDRHIGLLNALSRNLPFAGASNLGKVGQVISMVSTLKSGSGLMNSLGSLGGLNGLGGLGNMGNMGNMAGMLRNVMAQPVEAASAPSQADGIKDTVNKLLGGMNDQQKSDLMEKAKSFLGK